jgi:hypothetical protein
MDVDNLFKPRGQLPFKGVGSALSCRTIVNIVRFNERWEMVYYDLQITEEADKQ